MDEKSLRAIQNVVKAFGAGAPLIEGLRSFAAQAAVTLADPEMVAKLTELGAAIQAAEAAVRHFEEKGSAIVDAVHAKGMIVPSSQMSLHDVTNLREIYDEKGAAAVVAAVEAEYNVIFERPDFLDSLWASWSSSSALQPRLPILKDALGAHRHGLFGASIPTLIAQAEGLIVALRGYKGKVSGPTLQNLLGETLQDDTFVGPTIASFFKDTLYAAFKHGESVGPFSRNAILHGGDVVYATEKNSRTAIMLVDVLVAYE